jgi:hypothetical protein
MKSLQYSLSGRLYGLVLAAAFGGFLLSAVQVSSLEGSQAASGEFLSNDAAVDTIRTQLTKDLQPNPDIPFSDDTQLQFLSSPQDRSNAVKSKMKLMGRWPFGASRAVAFDSVRQLAFLGSGAGIFVLDVFNPLTPTKVSEITTPGLVNDLVYDNNFLYVADGSAGLRIFDVSNVAAPQALGSFKPVGAVLGVAVSSGLAYVVDAVVGLTVVNVTNPAAPAALGTLSNLSKASRVVVSGLHVFVADNSTFGGTRVFIVNVNNPAAPVLKFDLPVDGVTDLTVDAGKLYASRFVLFPGPALSIFDVTNPASPTLLGSLNGNVSFRGVVVQGTKAFALTLDTLKVVDIGNPALPTEVASLPVTQDLKRLLISGSRLYAAASRGNGLRILDVSNPLSPTELAFFATPDTARNIKVVGTRAYVADAGGGLRILNVSDPALPKEIGSFQTPFAAQVAVKGTMAYVADAIEGLFIVDISDPTAPSLVGQLAGPFNCVDVVGSFAYVAGFAFGVVDVSNPASPTLVGSFAASVNAIKVVGSLAFAVNGAGLQILDVSNPAAITEISTVTGVSNAGALTLTGSRVYIGSQNDVLAVDVSNPTAPVVLGQFVSGNGFSVSPFGMVSKGSFLYLGRSSTGFKVVDTRKPEAMVEIDNAASLALVMGLDFNKRFLYAADSEAGVMILAHTGSLKVNLRPQLAKLGGARWRIAGKALKNSGQRIDRLIPGNYTVRFKAVPGFIAPVSRKISIGFGQDRVLNVRFNPL